MSKTNSLKEKPDESVSAGQDTRRDVVRKLAYVAPVVLGVIGPRQRDALILSQA